MSLFYRRSKKLNILRLFLLVLLSSCGSIKQNILFKTESSVNEDVFKHSFESITANYKIQVNDRIAVSVFTNKGERLVDPNHEFNIGSAPVERATGSGMSGNQSQMQNNTNSLRELAISSNNMSPTSYLIEQNGTVNLPMVGEIKLEGLTLKEADNLLAEKYTAFYEAPFVVTQYQNKRIVLMGALGDQVIPLRNENMTLLEVLSLAGDVQARSKPSNIRLIRGPWDAPSVKIINLTSISNIKDANIIVEPNDIIYVEPRRRIDRETIQDFNIIFTPITTLVTLSVTMLLLIKEAK
ncbi:polysaccharide biosynthesis/export family protein [Chondrinema litorale]|uniref:polysaccharide biosynthesis/export family protein n=1 Tax=Chondrinema litorale TaxID=2994555 RepID=UPI002543E83C|nr:polysaccharide biosynthesis/export family protein [Chondrinema litorale]UZR92443.1 polysaccharide biosynthesis/export family protein [Chondrinema litorale]